MSQRILPKTIGGYEVLSRIAVGGMAEIFLARTRGFGGFEKRLVLKRLHDEYADDDSFVRMLIDEARITAQLQHANIVQVFDLGKDNDHVFMAMELVDGKDLYQVLRELHKRELHMPLEAAVYVVTEACLGLHYAHTRNDPHSGEPLGIVHRDVSPQNVLLSWQGEVKLGDFGIVKAALRSTQTQVGVIKGKFYYMSPEQASGHDLDHRSDLFSAGIVLYEALTASPLYDDTDDSALLERVRNARIVSPREVRKDIPADLEAICMKALDRDRNRRFGTGMEMARALGGWLGRRGRSFTKVDMADFMAALFDPAADTAGPGSQTDPELAARFPEESGAPRSERPPAPPSDGVDRTRDLRVPRPDVREPDPDEHTDTMDVTMARMVAPPGAVSRNSRRSSRAEDFEPIPTVRPPSDIDETTARLSREEIAVLNQNILERMRQRTVDAVTPPPTLDEPHLVGPPPDRPERRRSGTALVGAMPPAAASWASSAVRRHPKDVTMRALLALVSAAVIAVAAAIIWLVVHPIPRPVAMTPAVPAAAGGPSPGAPSGPRRVPATEHEPAAVPEEPSEETAIAVLRPERPDRKFKLYVDGEMMAAPGNRVKLSPGRHTFAAEFLPERRRGPEITVELRAGQTTDVPLR